MECNYKVSTLTKRNWMVDVVLMAASIVTILSGVYFLIFPTGGYQGGRNPYYGISILFDRSTWEWLHAWIGLFITLAVAVHILLHWNWVAGIARRFFKQIFSLKGKFNKTTWINILIDTLMAVSFLASAISGMYFFLLGGNRGAAALTTNFLFSPFIWDVIHTWSSVIFIAALLLHLFVHWTWVENVTQRVFTKQIYTTNLIIERE